MVSFASIVTAVVALAGSALAIPAPDGNMTGFPFEQLMRRQSTPSSTGRHNGYYYSWWTDGASPVQYQNGNGGSYSVQWQSGGNFVGGKGWMPGGSKSVTYSGTFNPVNNGNAYLCIYGWTQNPLVEYYILENYGEYNPGNSAQSRGTLQAAGGTYTLHESTRVNQPSIEGTRTFQQYWAIRQQKRNSGTVNTGEFFQAWERAGMRMGNHNYMIVATEGYRSAGNSNINVETPA
ncbi:NAD(P)H-dependent D-xylose reductase (XR) [Pyricularia grisea]|uniref:Endo-1,4-beta-xylanase n=1 Tax=Pyricularia grisea TaxID=148305 RepID=A0A6P8ASC8_PYRGI|nr:uncharacterized protein PgNI_09110 [Pyricularia grisea]KAI6344748.1 NAD(P)H-dependent D-xylose reductase (XR) [Pyricularia grisea]TLD05002.1 hypothetical protein PgNI_09110 [Pyricularia grisea]